MSNGTKHIRSAPYHPATNGAAEKKALRARHDDGSSLEQALAAFLLHYCTNMHSTTGLTPSSLFIGREFCIRLDLLSQDIGEQIKEKQYAHKNYHDPPSKPRKLEPRQSVWAWNFCDGTTWF